MDNSDDFGTILKKLDELDAKEYSPRFTYATSRSNMAATEDHKIDSNESDFDDSEEDLASLLKDDEDDDIFAKKVFGSSPTKMPVKDEKPNTQEKIYSPQKSFGSPLKKTSKLVDTKSTSKEKLDEDILDDFLESSSSKTKSSDLKSSTPEKNKSSVKQSSFQIEDTDSLGDLDLNEFSPSKHFRDKKNEKIERPIEKDSAILEDLKTTKSYNKSVGGRRASFFDEFLQNLSPKHESNKGAFDGVIAEKPKIEDAESDEDILGAYMPTGTKKNPRVPADQAKSPKRSSNIVKKVKLKDASDNIHETETFDSKLPNSPEKDSSLKQSLPESKNIKNTTKTKRSEILDSKDGDDIDWLNYFKSSPKKNVKSLESKQGKDVNERRDITTESKNKPAFKRQSSADWLGLNEPKLSDDEKVYDNIKTDISSNLKDARPKTVSASTVRPRHQETNKFSGEWNDESIDLPQTIGNTPTTDLSKILKETDTKLLEKRVSTVSFAEDGTETNSFSFLNTEKRTTQNAQTVNNNHVTTKLKSPMKTAMQHSLSNDALHLAQVVNSPHEVGDIAALQSLQSMLNESIVERNKLIKENEAIKIASEDKMKTIEEFYKTEKKILEDALKTQELSLKNDFEIKMNLLEERLKLLTEEKNKQAEALDEKMKNVLEDHRLEIQKLKELHSQSISFMKQDHEEALARLKKLKDQEIEAILSTQAHSKSMQYLSDQLEARANELALLQNKIEQRSEAILNERQSLLEAKEKDQKALQLRLQRQLEDAEEERARLQQLILHLEGRLQKMTMEGEENHWETQQLKAKLTVQKKYMEEEQNLNEFQIQKEKDKLKIAQDALLQEQKAVLIQLSQERQQLNQEKAEMQSLAKRIKEEESKLKLEKLKEESAIQAEKRSLLEEKDKLHFEKENIKQKVYQLERERDSLLREKQYLKRERDDLHEREMDLKRKSSQIEEMAGAASMERERARREYSEALAIKKEQQFKFQEYSQQMRNLMEKERHILSEKEKLIAEKEEFEQNKNSVLCTKCKLSLENPVQVSSPSLNLPVVYPLPNMNGLTNHVQQPPFMDPRLIIWQITAQKDNEFLQEELAFLKSLKESKRGDSK